MSLLEANPSKHYFERKAQRGVVNGVQVQNKEVYGTYDRQETDQKLLRLIQAELDKRLTEVEGKEYGQSKNFNLGYRFFMPVLVRGTDKSPIKMQTSKGEGHYHFVTIVDNTITTLMLTSKNKEGLQEQVKDHIKRKYPENTKEVEIMTPQNFIFEIDIDALHGVQKEKPEETKVSEEDLDYKPRTDYRVGATFTHKTYGTGKIVATSAGVKGIGDSRGIVDWIDVDFGKPYVKGGKLYPHRRFERILTKVSGRLKEVGTLGEMSETSVDVPEFIEYVTNNVDAVTALGYSSLGHLLDDVKEAGYKEWDKLRDELEDYKAKLQKVKSTDALLKEYVEKRDKAYKQSNKVEYFRNAKKIVDIYAKKLETLTNKYNADL